MKRLIILLSIISKIYAAQENPFDRMPPEIFSQHIAKHLSRGDIRNLSLASKQTRALAQNAVRRLDLSHLESIELINAALQGYAGPQLLQLNLEANPRIEYDAPLKLSLLEKCTALQKLNLGGWPLKQLPQALSKVENLRELSLEGVNLSGADIHWNRLPKSLIKLDLSYAELRYFPAGLTRLTHLQVLKLNTNRLKEADLSKSLSENSSKSKIMNSRS